MKMPDSRIRRGALAATALVATIVLIALGASVPTAFAQEATDQPSESETMMEDPRTGMHEQFAADLAAELGIEEERVTAALEAVRTTRMEERRAEHRAALAERLDAAVEDGDVTREQADAILEAHDAGALGGLGGPGGIDGRGRGFGHGHPGGFGPM